MSQRKPQADPRHAPRKSPSRRSRQDNHRRPTSRRSDKAQTRSTPAPSKMSRPPTTQNHSNRDAMKINRRAPHKEANPHQHLSDTDRKPQKTPSNGQRARKPAMDSPQAEQDATNQTNPNQHDRNEKAAEQVCGPSSTPTHNGATWHPKSSA